MPIETELPAWHILIIYIFIKGVGGGGGRDDMCVCVCVWRGRRGVSHTRTPQPWKRKLKGGAKPLGPSGSQNISTGELRPVCLVLCLTPQAGDHVRLVRLVVVIIICSQNVRVL